MSRLILILLVVAGLWWLIKVRSRPRGPAAPEASPTAAAPDTMVVCAHCGVHLPRREALPSLRAGTNAGEGQGAGQGGDGLHFCSEAHRQAGRAAAPPT